MGDPLGFDSPPATPGAPHAGVRALVTLGTPQRPPPAALARDMTGGVARTPLLPLLEGHICCWLHSGFALKAVYLS